ALHIPAALLLAPMFVSIVFAVRGKRLELPRSSFLIAQGLIGAMVAQSLPLNVLGEISKDWPIFLFGTFATIFISCFLGWCLSRLPLLPGSTAVWGLSPGAASVMTLMSEDYGADMRLVAFMQYLRMLCCAVSAALVGLYLGVSQGSEVSWASLIEVNSWRNLAISLVIAVSLPWLNARYFKVSGGALILPIFACMAVKLFTPFDIELPFPILALAYAFLGWAIGFRFTRDVIRHAAKLFPYVFGAIILLLLANTLLAWALTAWIEIDFLSAFLATSPGGMDAVAIIATSTQSDVAFVMAMQLARFIFVLILCPLLARALSKKLGQA
ncbi:MAG: AbrB family transcriptional regulator, partial [Vibrio sp.]